MQTLATSTSRSARLCPLASADSLRSSRRSYRQIPRPSAAPEREQQGRSHAVEQWQLSAAAVSLSTALFLAPADTANAGLFGGGQPKPDPRLSAYESIIKSSPSTSSSSSSSTGGYKLPETSIRCPPGYEISFPKSTAIVQCIRPNTSEASATVADEPTETAKDTKATKAQPPPFNRSDALREALKAEDALDALESGGFEGITIEGLKD